MENQPLGRFLSISSVIVGAFGLVAWLIPVFGAPMILSGVILGIHGYDSKHRAIASIGLVLCLVSLILTTIQFFRSGYMG